MIDYIQIKELIEETLKEIGLYTHSATNLLLGTMAQESKFGTYIKQIKGPALGIFQMEPDTHDDIWKNYLYRKESLVTRICNSSNIPVSSYSYNANRLIYNLKYAICMTRIYYLRFPEPLPRQNDVQGLAIYWKKYYNTDRGKGTTSEFIKNYNNYIAKKGD